MASKVNRDPTMGGQFALIPASVLYDDELPATSKLLYGEIYRLSQSNGYCYASNEDFIRILGCSDKTVRRLIAALAKRGHVRVKMIRRYGSAGDIIQRRIFCGLALAPDDPPEDTPDTPQDAPSESQKLGKGGPVKNVQTSGQKCPDGPVKNDHHTDKENKNKRNTPIVPIFVWDAVMDFIGDDPEYEAAFEGFLENRAALKKPVKTTRAIAGIINRLRKINHRETEIAMLDKATECSWLTVYPLRTDELPGGAPSGGATTGGVVEEEGVLFIDE